MKNGFSNIIANDDLCSYFDCAIRSKSLAHGYILLGPRGSGKHALAHSIAAALNCENVGCGGPLPCLECPSCKKIMQNASPDVKFISREEDRATLGIDPIRQIKDDVSFYPNDGDYKIYIIEDAHTMTAQAQNAFLLTLEEPPSYAVFILLCESVENILETVKSRAPILRMRIPSESDCISYLCENHPAARSFIKSSPEEFEQIYKEAGGSIGRILELIGSGEKKQILENRATVLKLVVALGEKTLERDFSEIAASFSQKRDEREKVTAQLSLLQVALRDLLVVKKADEPVTMFFTDIELAKEIAYGFSAKKLASIIESVEEARLALLRNANVRLTVINLLSGLI